MVMVVVVLLIVILFEFDGDVVVIQLVLVVVCKNVEDVIGFDVEWFVVGIEVFYWFVWFFDVVG